MLQQQQQQQEKSMNWIIKTNSDHLKENTNNKFSFYKNQNHHLILEKSNENYDDDVFLDKEDVELNSILKWELEKRKYRISRLILHHTNKFTLIKTTYRFVVKIDTSLCRYNVVDKVFHTQKSTNPYLSILFFPYTCLSDKWVNVFPGKKDNDFCVIIFTATT